MSDGIFFFVVGPSGAGKDSLIDAVRGTDRPFEIARRVITRAHGSPGEDHEALGEAEFSALERQGGFLITWSAHGLKYGLRRELLGVLAHGRHVIANGSRAMVEALRACVPNLVVIEVSAPVSVLAERILARGRETPEEVGQRVMRKVEPFPADVEVVRVSNDGTLEQGIGRFIAALDRATQPPAPSMAAMKAKLAGDALNETENGARSHARHDRSPQSRELRKVFSSRYQPDHLVWRADRDGPAADCSSGNVHGAGPAARTARQDLRSLRE